MLRIGTAGWSYPDWEGVVYPKGAAGSRQALSIVSGMFDTIEINVTFYRPPTLRMTRSWVARVSDKPRFRFTAKLWQGFTHRRDVSHAREERAFKDGIAPLVEAGRLGALLIQFPHSFSRNRGSAAYLQSLLDRFADYPLAVELRHASWLDEEPLRMLDARGAGFCNVDQPASRTSIGPSSIMTGRIGYVRLHGRNAEAWFRKDAGRDQRYDYLYSHEEIAEWVGRIRQLQRKAGGDADVFIIANNHYRGKAPANALELLHAIEGRPVRAEESLIRAYPRLDAIAVRTGRTGMLPL